MTGWSSRGLGEEEEMQGRRGTCAHERGSWGEKGRDGYGEEQVRVKARAGGKKKDDQSEKGDVSHSWKVAAAKSTAATVERPGWK